MVRMASSIEVLGETTSGSLVIQFLTSIRLSSQEKRLTGWLVSPHHVVSVHRSALFVVATSVAFFAQMRPLRPSLRSTEYGVLYEFDVNVGSCTTFCDGDKTVQQLQLVQAPALPLAPAKHYTRVYVFLQDAAFTHVKCSRLSWTACADRWKLRNMEV
jgi:hypothetical protein